MNFDVLFFVNSILLGMAFSANAFAFCLKHGNAYKEISTKETNLYSGIFASMELAFSFLGCILAFIFLKVFPNFQSMVPGISVILLFYVGGKAFYNAYKWSEPDSEENITLNNKVISLQGVASFLDAISVGFVFYYYGLARGLLGCLIMTIFGFIICKQGFFHGKHFGVFRTQRGYVYAGIIMILVGIELFIKGVFM